MLFKTKHYLKSAIANLRRNTGYTLLMVFSLALGMYCFVMSGLYVRYELSRNLNHKNAGQVYRLSLDFGERNRYIPYSFVEQIRKSHPEIETISTINLHRKDIYLSVDSENYIKEEDAFYANSELFDVFTLPLKYGNEKTALSGSGKVIISGQLAEILFSKENPIGQKLFIHDKGAFLVSGVMEDISKQSVLKPDLFFSEEQLVLDREGVMPAWSLLTHVKVKLGVTQEQLERSLSRSALGLMDEEGMIGVTTEKLADAYWGWSHADYGAQYFSIFGVDKQMTYIVLYVSIGVLICAFIGFVAISLGLSLKRAKEVGIRKVNGANTTEIRRQFLIESIAYSMMALLVTVVALELSQSKISELFQVPITLNYDEPQIILSLLVFSILTGLIAGAYPAFVVSRLNPVKVLSGFSNPKGSGFFLKKALLTFQFVIAVIFIFGIYISRLQTRHMLHFDHGYLTQNIITFDRTNEQVEANWEVILDRIQTIPGVIDVSGGPFPLNFNGFARMKLQLGDSLIEDSPYRVVVAPNFFEVMGVDIVEGASFDMLQGLPIANACIVNESFLKAYGLKDLVGKSIQFNGVPKTVIGVSKDYAFWGGGDPVGVASVYFSETKGCIS